jgi:hypothetical protein
MAQTITHEEGCWLLYQLRLNGYNQTAVAREAKCSAVMITQFLRGIKNSERVRAAFCKLLGYGSFEKLLAKAATHGKGGAA